MICDGCGHDCTVTVVWRDFLGRETRRCVRCGGGEPPDSSVLVPTTVRTKRSLARREKR